MPTVRIFGQEVERKQLLIGGGLLAAAVAVIVFLRARAASQAGAQEASPQPQDQAAAGGGMSVAAPTGQVADAYQQQMNNSELEASAIANKYQSNLVAQQQKQFEFQQSQAEALAPEYLSNERARLAADTHYNKTVASTKISCPGGQGVAQSPDGQLYCRQKTSGGVLGIPLGDIARTFQGFVGGVEAAAPEIGYQAAKDAAQYYTGKQFRAKGVVPSATKKLPPIAASSYGQQMSGHGYEEHIG